MSSKEDFFRRLKETFKLEAREHLQVISQQLLDFEKNNNYENLTVIYREVHSFKGAARAVDRIDIELICQQLEEIFSLLKSSKIKLTASFFNELYIITDFLDKIITTPEGQTASILNKITKHFNSIQKKLGVSENVLKKQKAGSESIPEIARQPIFENREKLQDEVLHEKDNKMVAEKLTLSGSVRVATAKLNSLYLQTEELLTIKNSINKFKSDINNLAANLNIWCKNWRNFNSSEIKERKFKNEEVLSDNIQFFLNDGYKHLITVNSIVHKMENEIEKNSFYTSEKITFLLDEMKSLLMQPFSTLTDIFPRMIRDLAQNENKELDLEISGANIELDRRILEVLKSPLIHILRNSVYHGVEKPEIRRQNNKTSCAKIKIDLKKIENNKLELKISDDGAGINLDEVIRVARKQGHNVEEPADAIKKKELIKLIFLNNVSTSPVITDISGRGLGLAIVQEKIDELDGTINVITEIDKGTIFKITLPVTLSTFRGISICLNNRLFVVPTKYVNKVTKIKLSDIKKIENNDTVSIADNVLPVIFLSSILNLHKNIKKNENKKTAEVLVVSNMDKSIALVVDEIRNEQEVVVKNLGKQLQKVKNIIGVTLISTGELVPVLNIPDLVNQAIYHKTEPVLSNDQSKEDKIKIILIVEDSITSRILLKNILESAGYKVKSAVNGLEALSILKSEKFDLIVSDVDMPEMDGFNLTKVLREQEKYFDLPIVLVTSLESNEDKKRGIEVGANAYIVKSSFDQSNLLKVVESLI